MFAVVVVAFCCCCRYGVQISAVWCLYEFRVYSFCTLLKHLVLCVGYAPFVEFGCCVCGCVCFDCFSLSRLALVCGVRLFVLSLV